MVKVQQVGTTNMFIWLWLYVNEISLSIKERDIAGWITWKISKLNKKIIPRIKKIHEEFYYIQQ